MPAPAELLPPVMSETHTELSRDIVVTSETFPHYTLPFVPLASREHGLAPRLSLGDFAPHIREIDNYVYGGQGVEILPDTDSAKGNEFAAHQRVTGRVDQVTAADPFAPEYGRTFYFDPEDGEVHYTAIRQGERRSQGEDPQITLGVFSLIDQKKIPMMPVHNHYFDGLLSLEDWNDFWQELPNGWRPTVRSSMILGPTKQTLVVATADTLKVMQGQQYDRFKNEWRMRYQNEDKDQLDALEYYLYETAKCGGADETVNPSYRAAKKALQQRERVAYDRVDSAIAEAMGVGVYQATDYENFERII